MRCLTRFFLALVLPLACPPAMVRAQSFPVPRIVDPVVRRAPAPPLFDSDDRSGPRVGVAALIGGSVTAERAGRSIAPVVTLFGWQIEHQFDSGVPGWVPVTEFVALAGGMEQGVFLPSVSWLVGMRQPNGWEAGVGPTLTGAGVQIALAGGVTRTVGRLNVPLTVAVAPGRRGASISLTTGFNMRRDR